VLVKGLIAALMGLLALPMSCMFCLVPPKDLGVRPTKSDYQTYVSTGGWQINELKPSGDQGKGLGSQGTGLGNQGTGQGSTGTSQGSQSTGQVTQGIGPSGQVPGQEGKTVQFTGQRPLTVARTSEQLTALANSSDLKAWKYYPVQNVQIRINNDGSVDSSGRIASDRLLAALSRPGLDMTTEERGLMTDYGQMLKGNPAFYMKFTGGVTNNKVNVNFSKAEIGPIAAPSDAMGEVNNHVASLIMRKMVKVPGLSIKSLTFQSGKMNFDGTVPDKIYMQH
jgi:hypothetical protein